MSTVLIMYVTCASVSEAQVILSALLDDKLVACGNIQTSPIESHYVWQDVRETSAEHVLMLKTLPELFKPVCTRVRDLHSYETPAILAWPTQSDADYAAWVKASCSKPEG